MKRNMDLVREILLKMEEGSSGWAHDLVKDGFSPQEIGYHAHLMIQAGLIDGTDITSTHSGGPAAMPTSLTWKGHDFLDAAREPKRWNQAKAIIAPIGSATIAVWVKVLTEQMLKGIGMHP